MQILVQPLLPGDLVKGISKGLEKYIQSATILKLLFIVRNDTFLYFWAGLFSPAIHYIAFYMEFSTHSNQIKLWY